MQDVLQVVHTTVAQDQASKVDGQKTTAADAVGECKDQDRTTGNE